MRTKNILILFLIIFSFFILFSISLASDYCPACGAKVEVANKYCPECGAKLGGSSSSPGSSGLSNLIRGDNWSKEISFKNKDYAAENLLKSDEFNDTGIWHVYHNSDASKITVNHKIVVDNIAKMEFKCKLQINTYARGIGYIACTYLDESEKELGSSIILCGYEGDVTYDKLELKNKPDMHIIEANNSIQWKACRIDFQDEFETYLYGIDSKEVKFIEIRLVCATEIINCYTTPSNNKSEIWAGDFDLRSKGGLIK